MSETPDIFRLGGYRIESLLGRGGMGEVYLAYDERLHRHVALKRIRADGPIDAQVRARFRREAQAAARLNHPSIVQIYDILDTEHGDCIVMEYVAGESVAALMRRGPLGLARALRLASAVADGLGEAHAKGLVHRDLKAENVLVTAAGHAKVLDFGLALPLWGNSPSPALTQEGALLGTVHAMSPEQASGRTVDHRSDLFALGVLLYELVTGRAPFRGANLLDTLRRVTSEAPAPLAEVRADAPTELVALVERLLEKEPERRPQSARLVAAELSALATRVPQEAPPVSREAVPPRPAPAPGEASGDEPTASHAREALATPVPPDSAPEVPVSGDAPTPDWRPGEGWVPPQRRVLAGWGAAALVLMLAVVSVFALRAVRAGEQARAARAEAELRRHQADQLISFMLGDLYGKLEPLGKLAILQDVGDKALEYLATVPPGEQTPEELMQRSKVLGQIGQVRFGQGKFAEASRAFLESLQVARTLVEREPGNGKWLFALGQSEYWVGFALTQRKDLKGALEHFEAYLDVSRRLVTMDARNTDWQLELAYAHSNIASLQQMLGDGQAASSALGASATIMETLRAQRPDDVPLQRELSQVYAKLGDAARSRGALPEALKWFRQNLELLESLATGAPQDAGLRRLLGIAHSHVGDLLLFQGDTRGALAQYEAELDLARRLAEQDADNVTWRGELLLRYEKVGRCQRVLGNLATARALFDTEMRLVTELLARSPEHRGWRFALARGHLSLAAVDRDQGQEARARGHLREALAVLEKLSAEAPAERDFPLWRASGLWQLGQLEARSGASSRAHTAWEEALALLGPAEKVTQPQALDVRARLLLGLGRVDEARPLLEALDKMGYADEESLRIRHSLARQAL